jgi:hypothetical protein
MGQKGMGHRRTASETDPRLAEPRPDDLWHSDS